VWLSVLSPQNKHPKKMFKQKSKILIPVKRALLLAILIIVTVASFVVAFSRQETARAATNSTINFQARLLTAAGNLVPDGNYNVEFKLYNALSSSGSSQGACAGDSACLWTETRTTTDRVRTVNGYMTVNLVASPHSQVSIGIRNSG
jgi:hypothetical protein